MSKPTCAQAPTAMLALRTLEATYIEEQRKKDDRVRAIDTDVTERQSRRRTQLRREYQQQRIMLEFVVENGRPFPLHKYDDIRRREQAVRRED